MKTFNGYVQVKLLENGVSGIVMQGESPVVEVLQNHGDIKKGDHLIYSGKKITIKTEKGSFMFVNINDVIAVL